MGGNQNQTLNKINTSQITGVLNTALAHELNQFKNHLDKHAKQNNMQPFPATDRDKLTLYPVVDDVSWIEKLLPLGVKTIQLRIKNPEQADLEQQVAQAVVLGRRFQAQIYINDYWQLAIRHKAYGVHLGQEDMLSADMPAIQKSGLRLGISTHSFEELMAAALFKPSYIALGHIFATTTKQMPSEPQGLERLNAYQQAVNYFNQTMETDIATVAIGGIDESNIASVMSCGVNSVAVVRAITERCKPDAAVAKLAALMAGKGESRDNKL